MEKDQLKPILEAVLMAASQPMTVDALLKMFPEIEQPEQADMEAALAEMEADCEGRSYELKKVSSGYRFQVRKDYADYVTKLWDDKPARYSRALLETLALIAYRQPLTRGEIEAVRGVSVSSHLIKTLHERDWIKVVGHRDVPGKPSLYATTKEFLDYFNLASLDDLPSLQDIRDIDQINAELDLRLPEAAKEGEQPESTEQESVAAAEGESDDATVINLETADDDTEVEPASDEAGAVNVDAQAESTEQEAIEVSAGEIDAAATSPDVDDDNAELESMSDESVSDESEAVNVDESSEQGSVEFAAEDDAAVISLEAADEATEADSASNEPRDEDNPTPSYEAAPASIEN